MKKIILFSVVIITIIFSSCTSKEKKFSGYIPVEEKPSFNWIEDKNSTGLYELDGRVLVVTETDSIVAHFGTSGTFRGSRCVIYKDSYPRTIGKKVYVEGRFVEGVPFIFNAFVEGDNKKK